jgi:predicted alpha-1,6-mannanase (GH76 family)
MTAGWDDACGGGLWWSTARRYKNAITNELFLTLAARLHQRVAAADGPPGGYLDWARREWDWFAARGLIGPAGLVNDGLTAECVNNGGLTWTYNQGVILGGLAALYDITGDRGYLDQGVAIADAAIRQLGRPAAPGGPAILTEPYETATRTRDRDRPQFKGVFVRYLADFSTRHGRPDYREFIVANARSAWERSRTDRDEFGLSWAGPFDRADAVRQSAALDLLNAAVAVTRA